MSETRTLQQSQLDHLYGLGTLTAPTAIYFSLWTTKPGLDGSGGVEVSGGGYAREAIAVGGSNFSRAGQVVTNDNAIEWNPASAAWGTIVAVGIHFSLAGSLQGIGDLTTPQTVDDGDTFVLPANVGFTHTKLDPA